MKFCSRLQSLTTLEKLPMCDPGYIRTSALDRPCGHERQIPVTLTAALPHAATAGAQPGAAAAAEPPHTAFIWALCSLLRHPRNVHPRRSQHPVDVLAQQGMCWRGSFRRG